MYGFIKLMAQRYREAALELAAHDPSVRLEDPRRAL